MSLGKLQIDLEARIAKFESDMGRAARIMQRELVNGQKAAERANQQMRQTMERNAQRIEQSARAAAAVIGSVFAVRQIVEYAGALSRVADGYANIQAKVRLAAGENANMAASFDKIFGVAQRTYNSLDGTAALVQRGSTALQNFGQSAEDAFNNSVKLAEVFNKSLVVSGASSEEAAAAALQFSQALASGRFQGDEFRSVMENNSRFAQLLADSLGVNIAQLREMSKEGKLTTQSFLDLLNKTGDLDKQFAAMPLTIGRAKTLLDNAFTKFIGQADQARGVSQTIASSMAALANNIGPVVSALGTLSVVAAGAFAGRGIAALKSYTAGVLEQANASKLAQAAAVEKATADAAAAQQALLRARGEQVAAQASAAAAAVDRQRIQSVIAMAAAQEAAIRANGLRATSEIELARLSQQLTAVENARAAATAALGAARQAEVRANAELLTANRALQAAYVTTGNAGAASAAKITLGMRAATIAQDAMTLATKGFSAALALVGGPLGAVIIGVGLLATAFMNSKAQADAAAASYDNAIRSANNFFDFKSRETALQAASDLVRQKASISQQISDKTSLRSNFSITGLYVDRDGPKTAATLDREIDTLNARYAETSRQLERVNAQIMANHEAWSANGAATAGATSEIDEQNKALEKERQQLTARRIELTKGYRARIEYEAMQAQGVQSADQLDARTRSLIDAMAREHAAIEGLKEGRKAATRADREALTLAKQQESQYQSTIDKINRQIALDQEAMLVNDKMTEAERLRVIVTSEMASAKSKLSDAEKGHIKALLDEAVAQGKARHEMDEARKAAESMLQLQNQLNEAYRTRAYSNIADLMGVTNGADIVERMRRVVDLQSEYQRQVESLNEKYTNRAGSAAQEAAYQNELAALGKHYQNMLQLEADYQAKRAEYIANGWNGANRALEDYIARARDVAGQTQEIMSGALSGLENVFTDFFTKGKADWRGYLDGIAADITRFVVRQQLSKLAQRFLPGVADKSQAGELQSAAAALAGSAGPLYGAAAALHAAAASLAAAGAGGGGSAAGALSSLGSGGSGGSWWGSALSWIGSLFGGGRATGGPVMANSMYEVNERGPELLSVGGRQFLMMGSTSGYVSPGGGGSGGNITQNFYNPVMTDKSTATQRERDAARRAQRSVAKV